MPTKKIAELPFPCTDLDHDPPKYYTYESGIYEHQCPSCEKKQVFRVTKPVYIVK